MKTNVAHLLFDEINEQYFFNVLPPVSFVRYTGRIIQFGYADPMTTRSEYGFYDNETIFYRRKLSNAQAYNTIAHEMIHHYQWFSKWTSEDFHGFDFWNVALIMERDGLRIF